MPSSSRSRSRSRHLPDELVWEIISRVGTVNEVVRCSSLLSKRWRNVWRSMDGGVLELDKSDELPRRDKGNPVTVEEERRFADWVGQALTCLKSHHHRDLDGMKICFTLSAAMKQQVPSWVEFGLTKRVKQLSLSSYYGFPYTASVCFFTPQFLAQHDLSRLQVLEFYGLTDISHEAVNRILSDCPSLQHLALRHCEMLSLRNRELAVIRVHSSNSLRCLDIDETGDVAKIQLISAPRLHTFNFRKCSHVNLLLELKRVWEIEFGDDLPRLEEALLSCNHILLPWSARDFSKFGPRLQRLGLEFTTYNFLPQLAAYNPEWLLFEKLTVLDLFTITSTFYPVSLLECTILLRAAPMLRELSIWFKSNLSSRGEIPRWERRDLPSTWEHRSLKVLHLHGVYPNKVRGNVVDFCNPQFELAAYIIMSTPSLCQVVIDTRHQDPLHDSIGKPTKLSDPIEAYISEAKLELETQLQGRSASPHINFIYQ